MNKQTPLAPHRPLYSPDGRYFPITDISPLLGFYNLSSGRSVPNLGDPAAPDCWAFLTFLLAKKVAIDGDVIAQTLGQPSVKHNIYETKSRVWVGICSWEFLDDDRVGSAGAGYVLFGADKRVKQIIPPPFVHIESR